MNLYTEEEVKELALLADGYISEELMSGLTPIELPSDEEIEEKFDTGSNRLDSQMYESGFIDGAKWMKEQIQGGNK